MNSTRLEGISANRDPRDRTQREYQVSSAWSNSHWVFLQEPSSSSSCCSSSYHELQLPNSLSTAGAIAGNVIAWQISDCLSLTTFMKSFKRLCSSAERWTGNASRKLRHLSILLICHCEHISFRAHSSFPNQASLQLPTLHIFFRSSQAFCSSINSAIICVS